MKNKKNCAYKKEKKYKIKILIFEIKFASKNKYTHKRDTKRVMNLNEAYVPYVLTSVNTVGNISFGFRKVTN